MADVSKIKLNGENYVIKDDYAARESLIGTTDPTTDTVGIVGQFYTNSETNTLFQCIAATNGIYIWEIVGGLIEDEVYIGPIPPVAESVKLWLDTATEEAPIDPIPTEGSPHAVSSGGVYSSISACTYAISTKVDKVVSATSGDLATLDQNGNLTDCGKKVSDLAPKTHTHSASDITSGSINARITFDSTPTANSSNPVTSGGIKNYVDNFKCFHVGTSAPSNKNLLWIDTTATTGGLKYYNGSSWVVVPVSFS